MIPDKARVRKPKGAVTYVLRHQVTLYDKAGAKEVLLEGFFLVNGESGDISQIGPSKELLWEINADDLVSELYRSWHERRETV